jgi:hypothetical protein
MEVTSKQPCPVYTETAEHAHLWKANTDNYQDMTPADQVKFLAREYNKHFLYEVEIRPWRISSDLWYAFIWVPAHKRAPHKSRDGNKHDDYDVLSYATLQSNVPIKSLSLQAVSRSANRQIIITENSHSLSLPACGLFLDAFREDILRLIIESSVHPGNVIIGCRVLPYGEPVPPPCCLCLFKSSP